MQEQVQTQDESFWLEIWQVCPQQNIMSKFSVKQVGTNANSYKYKPVTLTVLYTWRRLSLPSSDTALWALLARYLTGMPTTECHVQILNQNK